MSSRAIWLPLHVLAALPVATQAFFTGVVALQGSSTEVIFNLLVEDGFDRQ